MNRIHVLVEGQTEEAFVRDLLQSHFWSMEIDLNPVIVQTKRIRSGYKFKGGISNYEKVRNDIRNLIGDTNVVAVTTMIDYYALPTNFPGYDTLPRASCYERVTHLMQYWQTDINHKSFIPFITLHEFEALLFVSPQQIASAFPAINIESNITNIKNKFTSPEEINDGDTTHPAAQLHALVPYYDKVFHGSLIAKRIGLHQMREECNHFNAWIETLENLSPQAEKASQ